MKPEEETVMEGETQASGRNQEERTREGKPERGTGSNVSEEDERQNQRLEEEPDPKLPSWRFAGPRMLIKHGIPCIIWCEDALRYYKVPTGIFDLFCLVEDPAVAARCLLDNGFSPLPENQRFQDEPDLVKDRPRLTDCPQCATSDAMSFSTEMRTVVLLPAQQWWFPRESLSLDPSNMFPSLHSLISGTVNAWLDAGELHFSQRLRVFLAYLYHNAPGVSSAEFVNGFKKQYLREFHRHYVVYGIPYNRRDYYRSRRDSEV